MRNVIEIQGLNVGYDKVLLKNLTFSLAHKEILIVLGTNGVGKSTLMKTLLGILPSYGGSIMLSTQNIGLMPQLTAIDGHLPMATEDFLGLFPWHSQIWKKEIESAFELTPYLKTPISALSCGLWQRVNIAQSLATQPELLFLDEPTQGLDIAWQKVFYEFLSQYAQEKNAGVCCISHDTVAISSYAHKVLCLDHQPTHDLILKNRFTAQGDKAFVLYQHHAHCHNHQHTVESLC